ncbi:hypothetical protein C5167_024656 [Papaver somniferum]|uniref:Uncharacterized protein n=1 Tax=Papaver somniferum TaxID=3469 RepID=A0A4Y7JT30_PAPSO|nr:uncharacterized protein LOC113280020 [Papaver somniferum]RZC62899.1 hypothetical protein C5167_024656 [Papaver somniferum]
MDMGHAYQGKKQNRFRFLHFGPDHNKLVIKVPHCRMLRVVSRSLLLSLVIFTFPWIFFIFLRSFSSYNVVASDPINGAVLPILFKDLVNEGILESKDNKGLLFCTGSPAEDSLINLDIFNKNNEMSMISELDIERQNSIPDSTFDFVMVSGFETVAIIDRMLKTGGVAVVQLSSNNSGSFRKPSHYRIEYLRRFTPTIVAMRKTGLGDLSLNTPTTRRLFGMDSEAERAALNDAEDVLYEPPRKALFSSKEFLKSTKFLPHLTGDLP